MESVSEILRKAARTGKEIKVKALLQDPGCDALAKDKNGMTALMEAAWNGHEACVRLLMPKSDTLAKTVIGKTALMYAAYYGHEAIVQLLLTTSDALSRDNDDTTALIWAAYGGREYCIKLLLPVSDVLAKDKDGRTASDYAKRWRERRLDQLIDAYALAQTERTDINAAANPGARRRSVAHRM